MAPENQSGSSNTTPPEFVVFNTASQLPLKLTSTNYVAWSFQVRTLLMGYDLFKFVDGSYPCPSSIPSTDGVNKSDPMRAYWIRQDQLILSSIIGSISPTLIPFIAAATTSQQAWSTLATIYGRSSRSKIIALKNKILNPVKGSKSITTYLLEIKSVVDELSLLGVVTDIEDLVLKILSGLDESYKEISGAIQARDTPISFEELHDKLLSVESQIATRTASTAPPATAFAASHRPANSGQPAQQQQRPNIASNSRPPQSSQKPVVTSDGSAPRTGYQGRCQYCGVPGHSAKFCTQIATLLSQQQVLPAAHTVQAAAPDSAWVLDSGVTHHITTDLANLSLHSPFDGSDSVVVGDGEGLSHGGHHSGTTAR